MKIPIEIEVETKNKMITIPTPFGDIDVKAKNVAVVKANCVPVYSIYYTENNEYIAFIPPSIMKIHDPIKFSEIFDDKKYGDLGQYLRKTIIPAMAFATGYNDVNKFIEEKLIQIEVEDYTGKEHEENIFTDSLIVKACIGEHCMITAWKKISTPTVPTIARFIIPAGLTEVGEKEFLKNTLEELKYLPFKDKEAIKEYAIKYVKYIAHKNLEKFGLI